jgi:hypothetical protein
MKGDYYWSLLTKHRTKIVTKHRTKIMKTCRGKLSKDGLFLKENAPVSCPANIQLIRF